MPQAPALSVTRIGRYELLALLATGGMAEIFLARQEGPQGFERPVVVKRVLPHLARQRVFRDMFLDEARIVSRIHHPNVVAVHELGDDQSELFLVMEYLEGESLATLMRRVRSRKEQLPLHIATHLAAEACGGLHAAHELADPNGVELGVVHRDVSPHNLFVLYSGHTKVIDFGIAKAIDRLGGKTETGQVKGKFAYMAPEQIAGQDVDRRADIFAMGVVLYELLTGDKLFQRSHDLLMLKAIVEDPIPRPSEKRPDIPKALDDIVMRALTRKISDRYQTAALMRRDLLTVERQLSGDELPEESLSNLLKVQFEDRLSEHMDLMRRFKSGQTITRVPSADSEEEASAPATNPAPSGTGAVIAASLPIPLEKKTRRAPIAFAAAAVAAFTIGVVAVARPWESRAPESGDAGASLAGTSTAHANALTPAEMQPTATADASATPSSEAATSASAAAAASASAALAAKTALPVVPHVAPVQTAKPPPPAKTGGFTRFD